MIIPEKHIHESNRLSELFSYDILDTLPDSDYDGLTKIAAQICGVPIALISLVDENRQWFKSKHGIDVDETPRDLAFCAHAINDQENTLIVEDAREDKRFANNPLVVNDPNVIFYGGVPIVSDNGLPLGTLCVIDHKPNTLSDSQKESLKALSKQVMNLLKLRKRNSQLKQIVEQLKEKNSDLEQFTYTASHDLKSPILNISNLAGMFLSEYKNEMSSDGVKIIELILKTSERSYQFLDRLLEYSTKIDNLEETKVDFELKDLENQIKQYYASDAGLEINFSSDLKLIHINTVIVSLILTNLITNAEKYNDKPTSIVNIRISESNCYYHFEVVDNGPGIKEEYQNKIFKIFQKLEKTDKHGNEGSGIGLAIVSKLVHKLGGTISVSSNNNEGSIFSFTILK